MNTKKYLFLTLLLSSTLGVRSQSVALKTNLLSDAFANINAGVEFKLTNRWTLEMTGEYNGWTVNDHKWKHWFAQPEFRYWFCDTFNGHFLGINAIGGQYNFANIKNNISFLGSDFSGLSDNRYQGWGAGAGISYGYSWIVGKHWNIEATLGIGYIYTLYDVFDCDECGKKIENDQHHNYFGLTKAAVNLVYLF